MSPITKRCDNNEFTYPKKNGSRLPQCSQSGTGRVVPWRRATEGGNKLDWKQLDAVTKADKVPSQSLSGNPKE